MIIGLLTRELLFLCFIGSNPAWDEEMIMKIIEVSDSVDADLFAIPADYAVMEMQQAAAVGVSAALPADIRTAG